MNDYIDIYCERVEPGLFAEPLNAISNLAFFVAAFFAFMLAARRNVLGLQSGLLVFLLICIGTGSTLFHTLATGWAEMADVIPILLFQIAFIIIYSRNVIKLSWMRTLILLLVFGGLIRFFAGLPNEWFNGSLGYAPALIFLSGFGLYHWAYKKQESFTLMLSALIFILSLIIRSMDMAICDVLPIGVHYFWHILNAIVLYLALRGLIMNVKYRL